ncbi:MAG: M14 family metallopeptidase [Acidobacteriota bacterium]
MQRRLIIGALAVAATLLTVSGGHAQSDAYLDFAGLTGELRGLVDGSPNASMRAIGTSHEGREVWLIEIADPAGAPLDERPGVLVVGNLAGDHVVGSQLALGIVRFLLEDASAADVLRDQVVYVVPRLNPDGAEAMFAAVKADRKVNALSFDADNDGRFDEDPAEDLNGDGMITLMRVPDPTGAFMIDPDDPRLMKRADKAAGETGTHTLYTEGVDSDGDGFLNEDGPGGVDLNRNFQHEYPYYQPDAGPYMVSEPESRALMDFVVAHRNIAAVLTFGESDNLVTPPNGRGQLAGANAIDLDAFAAQANADIYDTGVFGGGGGGGFGFGFGGGRGGGAVGAGGVRLRGAQLGADNDPQSGRRPVVTVDDDDLQYFTAVSDAYKEITGIERVGVNRTARGAFFQVAYFQMGLPSFSTQGWALPETDGRDDDFDATLLGALEGAGIDAFADWAPFDHPDLGAVEIGGFVPYATTNPPAAELTALERSHGEFVVRLAGMLPRVRIVDTEVVAHGGGVFTVRAAIENSGYFPTALQQGVVSRSVQPTTVRLQVDPDTILTGDAKSSTVQKLDGSGSRAEFSWVIRGNEGDSVEIWARSQKGGTDTATVTLR